MSTIRISYNAVPPTPASSPASAPAAASATPADSFTPGLSYVDGPRETRIAAVPGGWAANETRQTVAQELLKQLKAWPSLHAVIAVAPRPDGSTGVMVASEHDEEAQSEPGGVYGIISSLASSPSVKAAAAASPVAYEGAAAVAESADATVYEMRLPGHQDPQSVGAAIAEGRQPNQKEQLKSFLETLPKGERAVVLLAGPSGAGKTSLIKDLQALAGDRKVVALTGDMYFRDVDDPEYPKTAQGTHNFDSPEAMHMEELAKDIAKLVRDGKADIPVYDFAASRPGGWRVPISGVTGVRLDRKEHLELGGDDILVIDSIHAANAKVVDGLQEAKLPQYTLYLDSQDADARLLRRIVRDFATREGSAERTLQFWDLSTFPGEVHYVRPTMLQMDPSRDLYYVTKFGTDLGLSREEIEHKVAELGKYGLAPTYEAFGTPDDKLGDLAKKERARLEGVLAGNPADEKAKRALARLDSAALH